MHNISRIIHDRCQVFYAIGNTLAVNLFEYHAPRTDKGTTDILLLACGDPRSILYSLWCEGKPARNILLFSLIIDNATSYASQSPDDKARIGAIWNLFYHFFIPKEDTNLLRNQSAKLLSFSETLEKWAESPYSSVSFLSLQTLEEVRKIWNQYSIERSTQEQESYEAPRRADISKIFKRYIKNSEICSSYTAGVHISEGWRQAFNTIRAYWTSGVVAGNKNDIKALGFDGNGILNPTFAVSSVSERFVLSPSSNPLSGYHVPHLFDNPVDEEEVLEDSAASSKKDFANWCKAFAEYARAESVGVKVYLGDAVTFAHELACRSQSSATSVLTRLYASQWSGKPLLLHGPSARSLPNSYEIIDTSNIVDHHGHLNILSAVIPILSNTPSSVLYTESLRTHSDKVQDNLKTVLEMDVNVAALLLGLVPFGNVIGYTTANSSAEDVIEESSHRYRSRIPWRSPSLGDHHVCSSLDRKNNIKPKVDPDELSKLLFDVYFKMFSAKYLNNNQLFNQAIHYSRLSFVSLLQIVKRNISTNWTRFYMSLHGNIANEKVSIFGPEAIMETIIHLDISNVIPGALAREYGSASISFVTLVVPRKNLEVFFKSDSVSFPSIHLCIFKPNQPRCRHRFFAIDCFFGSLGPQTNAELCGEVVEDSRGFNGTADMIVSCPVSSYLLRGNKWHAGIRVNLDAIGVRYARELGEELMVYSI
ncbi:hypothetical protein NHQ30_000537 [Ciborinia camelliae]|nr:hypothetical protein NHQ30_000537 [Ciborinia camelliae]